MTAPITLYSYESPNSRKISVYLELLDLPYNLVYVDVSKNIQKEPWFTKLNPNGRIPTIEDPNTGITISQSGAILRYLAETYDSEYKYSYKPGTPDYFKELEVLIFQMAENGPIEGQAFHFVFTSKEKHEYAINRFKNETKRIYDVYEEYLRRNEENLFLVGPHISTADVALYPWAVLVQNLGISLAEWPLIKRWHAKLEKLEAVMKGFQVPS